MEAVNLLLNQFALEYPVVFTIIFIMGAIRPFMKSLFTFLHAFADATESKKDNLVLDNVEKSKSFKGFSFILDLLLSVKLERPKK